MTGAIAGSPDRPYLIGVTGNIASGKTTVVNRLAAHGATVIDADTVYHDLIGPGAPLSGAIAAEFGPGVLDVNGAVDRRALGAIVFRDSERLAALEAVTHPAIRREIIRRIAAAPTGIVVVDAVKLVEAGFHQSCDEVWVVVAEPEQQVERLMRRNGLDREEAGRRVAAQPPLAGKLAVATRVIDNRGTEVATIAQVDEAWQESERLAETTGRLQVEM